MMISSQLKALRSQLELLVRKVNAMKEAMILETQVDEQFRLEELILQHEQQMGTLKQKIVELEQQLTDSEREPVSVHIPNENAITFESFAAEKQYLQSLLFENLAKVLRVLKDRISADSDLFNVLVIRYGEYQQLQKSILEGTASEERSRLVQANIRSAITYIVNELQAEDLQPIDYTAD